ncbi:DUF4817 domain-containing protein [Trichonephila clavipes]|nr:DUF4817 domain-containing protein [Trichonephila clavipes]
MAYLLSGTDTSNDAISICKDIAHVLSTRGFHLRKWNSNSPEFLAQFSERSSHDTRVEFSKDSKESSKVLGLFWNSCNDTFGFQPSLELTPPLTKRRILSESSKIFDPLGLLSPCTVLMKIFYQKLWLTKADWDSSIPQQLTEDWLRFQKAFNAINYLTVTRWDKVQLPVLRSIVWAYGSLAAPKPLSGSEFDTERSFRLNCQVIYSQFGLTIHQNDHQARRRFVEWAQNEIAVVPDFHKRILFSDEAHFWLNGYVNKQNCRIWSEANPQVYVETPLHPEKLTVWCALWAGGIIGPYFFKNDEGHNVTVNGNWYRAMITNFFIPELNNHDVQELWFQQDGATCHTARATIDLLKDTFGDHLISRFGPVYWPPRSCDLTPLNYFMWVYVKSLVYADKPQTLDHFEDNIRRVIADIRPQMLEKVIENWTSRLDNIQASRGSPTPEIIFKM